MHSACDACGHKSPVTTRQAASYCGGLLELNHTRPPYQPDRIDPHTWNLFRRHICDAGQQR